MAYESVPEPVPSNHHKYVPRVLKSYVGDILQNYKNGNKNTNYHNDDEQSDNNDDDDNIKSL